ncbi:pro-sigmaK processing inhibitor BofA family protein [Priestia koreensis]|uniref:pro-sigmaK processing inhibitor BofA family protein n=1 Tax=Priestia koreensis TaxID=284581 RepID=UPI001F5AB5BC|nr:pro-sigmaK processing inhibitor BofA family protein [Priestia koreensis]UNL85053.1 pro-sigmaK processing inhibitor BofA family protein [Priestia koreensis]
MQPILVISTIIGLIVILLLAGGKVRLFGLVGQVLTKCVIGALLLFFINTFGAQFDIHVPINVLTTAVSGVLGLSGIGALLVISQFIL